MQQSQTLPTAYASELPYPEGKVARPNAAYGRMMLENIGGTDSEMSTVSLYFYNNLITGGKDGIPTIFHNISIVEMHHLAIFGKLARQLGQNPRLWACGSDQNMVYWSPGYNSYSFDLQSILINALHSEEDTIIRYRKQAEQIYDPYIVENLKRIILDEEIHVDIFKQLYQKYFGPVKK